METKTCPHCNEVAIRNYDRDYDMYYMWMAAYICSNCGKAFWLEEEITDEI